MGKRKISLKPGDVIEIPIGEGWLAYARKYEDCSYRPYRVVAKERPKLSEIITSGFLDIVTVLGIQYGLAATGEWPLVGKHPFGVDEDAWPPPMIEDTRVYFRGCYRPATAEEIVRFPPKQRFDEDSFVDHLRDRLLGAAPLERPNPPEPPTVDPLANAMSVDRNDIAEQVSNEFEEFLGDGCSPRKALEKVIRSLADVFDDSDTSPSFWLALASIGLKRNCLTKTVLDNALQVIESDQCWEIADNVDKSDWHTAFYLRRQAIDPLKKALLEQRGI